MPLIPLSWLGQHVDLSAAPTAAALAAALVKVGIEEEAIVPPAVTGPLVVGRVLTLVKETHKNGKTVNYCRVDVGEHNDAPGTGKEPSELPSRGIVCGAHNFVEGDFVVVSLPGTVLPGPFPIAARKTYGHTSDGMICSGRELGLSDDHEGIIVLTQMFPGRDFVPGEDAISLLGLGEEVLEVNITPDRGYCFSMRGLAREYAHSTGAAFTDPGLAEVSAKRVGFGLDDAASAEFSPAAGGEDGALFGVKVDDVSPIYGKVGCDVFTTRVVRGIDPSAPTPAWMADRLRLAGMRPISLAVDVTNYVMLDLGQPLHAYDLDKLSAPLVVRRAVAGEKFETLDGLERTLHEQDLLITDSPDGALGSRIQGLAGVMGGAASEVSESTTDVLVEAAHFDPVSIARAARRHKLPSEAAKRFERGVDPNLPAVASQAVVDLLVEYGGGVAEPAYLQVGGAVAASAIEFPLSEVARLTGLELADERIVALLEEIGCTVEGEGAVRAVTPPSWRSDLTGPAHFVEEVARLEGYEAIASVVPAAPAGAGLSPEQKIRREIGMLLAGSGLTEVMSDPFVAGDDAALGLAEGDARCQRLRLANPLADDAPFLRSSLLETLLGTVRRNVARGMADLALFEMGLVPQAATAQGHAPVAGGQRPDEQTLAVLLAATPRQPLKLAAVFTGQAVAAGPLSAARAYDWADAVQTARNVAAVAGARIEVRGVEMAPWHPGRCAELSVGQTVVGYAGELHPRVVEGFGLPERACALELDLSALLEARPREVVRTTPVSTFPVAKEDFAFVVPAELPAQELLDCVRAAAGDLAEDVRLFDVYTGASVGEGKKSLAVSVRLRAADKTLTNEDLADSRARIIQVAQEQLGAVLR
ncbi:MAG: phenylalanine--tRNA ligase subunit beta [Buchananella hordeovulneris]|nr:phenylalanine--tRNA ligase subunit beta [Buchananella hordeovulneris]